MNDRLIPALALLGIAAIAVAIAALLLVREPEPEPAATMSAAQIAPRPAPRPPTIAPATPSPAPPPALVNGEPPTPELPVAPTPLPALDGRGPEFPANLDDRFREAALKSAITDALRQMEMAGDVVSVDCGEYPCLVVGKVRGAIDAFSLRNVAATTAYERDNIWFYPGPAIGEARAFVVGWTPTGPSSPEMKSRIKLRQQHGIASVPADDLKAFFR